MSYREVPVHQVRETIRLYLAGEGVRSVARLAQLDRKTVRRYLEAAEAVGLSRDGGLEQLTDELVGLVCEMVRPARTDGRGRAWMVLEENQELIGGWVKADVPLTKVQVLLARRGVQVPYRTLHRFATERCEYGSRVTVRVADGEPGVECQVDFGRMGLIGDTVARRRRVCQALIFTACYSRHSFVWLSFSQRLGDVIAGCEAAWVFFGGVFKVLVPDNMKPIVDVADPVAPRFNAGFFEYAQSRGFAIDPARVRTPTDKGRVERTVAYVRGSLFAGEEFIDLADAQRKASQWCSEVAGQRIHRSTGRRPAEVFAAEEAHLLLAAPVMPYDLPVYSHPKVARDCHVEIAKSLYSVPHRLIGAHLDARADSQLVKLYYRGRWSRSILACRPAGATPTFRICRPARPSTPTATPTGFCAKPPSTASPSGSSRPGCWMWICPGPACARCTAFWVWCAATARPESMTPAPRPSTSTVSMWAWWRACSSGPPPAYPRSGS